MIDPVQIFMLAAFTIGAAGAGFFVGMLTSRVHTNELETTLAAARPRLEQTSLRLKGASGRMAQSDSTRDESGGVLVMSGTLANLGNDLAALEVGLRKRRGA